MDLFFQYKLAGSRWRDISQCSLTISPYVHSIYLKKKRVTEQSFDVLNVFDETRQNSRLTHTFLITRTKAKTQWSTHDALKCHKDIIGS
jgi:hypothetical protein